MVWFSEFEVRQIEIIISNIRQYCDEDVKNLISDIHLELLNTSQLSKKKCQLLYQLFHYVSFEDKETPESKKSGQEIDKIKDLNIEDEQFRDNLEKIQKMNVIRLENLSMLYRFNKAKQILFDKGFLTGETISKAQTRGRF